MESVFIITGIMTNDIESGVTTKGSDALKCIKSQLFERIRHEWPQIVQGI
ncbi:hypothetical protein GLOIN_2v1780972 [Rhizophagus irregularis DAOM 181602=DAOM 197198]|uniref:Uncharacterized protein n=1 Tax=Rhizophagus irregularis (strain DAOM 181602 / DAOM 197198 / MUCL 43194) TaxID=747089 RepID=A0A2P4PL34_RHIID|nr:hypothetical protein GLOIN_2v1780972 [Rhizophagus irregularis DAOM 181602=DAOM 197198]POG66085.1 hypothetical protein GLOIN_2v1780972 [Rhizophagus irregularis DAOM 181602=DAOM 197198]|eukprot:XP_025172951.1 hypothetical protein GLOIN_2v1780972 [Rhizophagus irregularis DAOM 181602=DAOM 197198]